MPRPKGIPSYSFHKPSGQARVRIDGKDHYLGPYDSHESKAEYQRLVRRTMADRARSELERSVEFSTDITVSEIVARYVRHVESYYVKNLLDPELAEVRKSEGLFLEAADLIQMQGAHIHAA